MSRLLRKYAVVGFVVAVGCFVVGPQARAAEDSILQMMLVNSARFQARVQYLAADQAITVLAEALGTACHADRLALAREVITGAAAQRVALAISRSNAGGRVLLDTVVDGATGRALTNATDETTLNVVDKAKVDSNATDLALASAITFYWNNVAKCYTGT